MKSSGWFVTRAFVTCGIVVVTMIVAMRPAAAQTKPACDRACLRTLLDQYLNAVIKHDPSAAPLMIGFRQTENAVVVRPGTGLWKSMTGLGAMQRRLQTRSCARQLQTTLT